MHGVVPTSVISASTPGEFSVNGQRSNANYFMLDGVSANAGINTLSGTGAGSNSQAGMLPALSASGSTSSLVTVDALQEFKIQTSSYSAEYGRQPGGQIQLISRAGSKDFHGTIYDYLRNDVFDARNWFNTKPARKPPLRQNQFGGTLSGPVMLPRFGQGGKSYWSGRDSTFFFFSYEGQRLRLPVVANFGVPSLRLRQLTPASLKPLINAFPIPTGPEFTRVQNGVTVPAGVAPYAAAYSDPKSLDATSIRIDHSAHKNHNIFARYNVAPSESLSRSLAQLSGSVFNSKFLTAGVTSVLSSRITNELRINYSRNRALGTGWMDDFGGAVPLQVSQLLSGYSGSLEKVQGRFSFSTLFGGAGIFIGNNADFLQRQLNIVDGVSVIKGGHQLKLGIDYRRLTPIYGPLQYSQSTVAQITNNAAEANFLNGIVTAVGILGQGEGAKPRFENYSTYVQDTWKVSRKLTIDFGLRWELNPTPTEADGKKPVFVVGVDNLPTARLATSTEPWYKTFYGAFAPRIGAAYLWRNQSGHETVVRGGFGVYYDLNSGEVTAAFQGFPFLVDKTLLNVPWPLTPAQASLPAQPTVALPITSTLFAINPELKLPFTLQWNFAIQQSLGASQTVTASYVASVARRLTTNQRLNQRVGHPTTGVRPNPNFAQINFITNGPSSDYHSMQLQYQRRLSRGIQALANYTWSHAIDEISNEVEQGILERGNASFDVRHNFSAAITYDLPEIKMGKVLSALSRGWSADSIVIVMSGQPLDIFFGGGQIVGDDGTFFAVRPDLVTGQPLWVADPNAPGGEKINVAAFAAPPRAPNNGYFLRQGTLGRNVVVQPARHQVNVALRRQIALGERLNLQVKAEVFNLFNHPLFSNYSTSFAPGSSAFGKPTLTLNNAITSGAGQTLNSLHQLGGPRSMQFSLKLGF